ncbi:Tetraspanin/Peripherin [Dillenia turbinata]|uniref:Tetraspanin/Peripherin n=1 Tax=Dillenia turbinata TaxID=194707 RepID=A0AAN8W2F3_9MAGN
MGVSNNVTAFLNFVALLCSIPIIGAGIWLASKPDNECIHFLRWPVVILGILILLVALTGFVGAYWNRESLLAFHLFCMAILISLLLILLVFAFIVTTPDGSYSVVGREYKEYRLDGFSTWLRDHVTSGGNWGKIQTCLAQSDVCSKLNQQSYFSAAQFYMAHISPLQAILLSLIMPEISQKKQWGKWGLFVHILFFLLLQSGCCKPPTICGYQYVNPTLWVNPTNPTSDPDCYAWNNDQTMLCYNCNSCKAGLLGNLREEWRKANVILIVTVVILIFVYIIACSAFRNAQTEDLFRRYKQGWA